MYLQNFEDKIPVFFSNYTNFMTNDSFNDTRLFVEFIIFLRCMILNMIIKFYIC